MGSEVDNGFWCVIIETMENKVYQWKLKDGTLNFYKEKALLNYVGRILVEVEGVFEVQDRFDDTVSKHDNLKEAKKAVRELLADLPPTNLTEWCEHYKKLDVKHETSPQSPLHHDNRCELCIWEKTWGLTS